MVDHSFYINIIHLVLVYLLPCLYFQHSATAEPGPMFNTDIEKNEVFMRINVLQFKHFYFELDNNGLFNIINIRFCVHDTFLE
jgi:hypothetical protein